MATTVVSAPGSHVRALEMEMAVRPRGGTGRMNSDQDCTFRPRLESLEDRFLLT